VGIEIGEDDLELGIKEYEKMENDSEE